MLDSQGAKKLQNIVLCCQEPTVCDTGGIPLSMLSWAPPGSWLLATHLKVKDWCPEL